MPFDGAFLVTQEYGEDIPFYAPQGYPLGHPGRDYGCPTGTPILACADGLVSLAGDDPSFPGRGHHVWLDHGNGYRTVYMHLDHPTVTVNDMVKAGELIGISDNSGLSSGSHLHLGLEEAASLGNGMRGFIDPRLFLT